MYVCIYVCNRSVSLVFKNDMCVATLVHRNKANKKLMNPKWNQKRILSSNI